MKCLGFRLYGLGLGFRDYGLAFGVWVLGFRVYGLVNDFNKHLNKGYTTPFKML